MTTTIGYQGDGARLPGFSRSSRPSQYYTGFWKCQQANGDDNDDRITDFSSLGNHATIGDLTTAEAWANSGKFSSLATANHWGSITKEQWGVTWATDSFMWMFQLTATAATSARVWGAGISTSNTGANLQFNSSGRLIVGLYNTSGTAISSSPASGQSWTGGATNTAMLAYDAENREIWIGTGGVVDMAANTNIAAGDFDLIDAAHSATIGIGGRAGATGSMVANQQAWVHSLVFPNRGLPSNVAALFGRYHSYRFTQLQEREIVW